MDSDFSAFDRGGLEVAHIDGRCIERVLDVGCIEFLGHLNAGAAVFGDLINVCAFHKPHTDISVSKAIGRTSLSIPVELQFKFAEDGVEQLSMCFRK